MWGKVGRLPWNLVMSAFYCLIFPSQVILIGWSAHSPCSWRLKGSKAQRWRTHCGLSCLGSRDPVRPVPGSHQLLPLSCCSIPQWSRSNQFYMCFCVGLGRLKVGHFHCLWAPAQNWPESSLFSSLFLCIETAQFLRPTIQTLYIDHCSDLSLLLPSDCLLYLGRA